MWTVGTVKSLSILVGHDSRRQATWPTTVRIRFVICLLTKQVAPEWVRNSTSPASAPSAVLFSAENCPRLRTIRTVRTVKSLSVLIGYDVARPNQPAEPFDDAGSDRIRKIRIKRRHIERRVNGR
jgi:hypothetical protein